MAKQNGSRVVTNKVRFLYPHLFEKYRNNLSGKESYCVTILIPKEDKDTVQAVEAATKFVADEARNNKNIKNLIHLPLRDGDKERADNELYKGCYFINCSTQFQPDVVDRRGNHISNPDEIYGGMYGRVSLNLFAYSNSGNRGISAGLSNVQKLEDGERLGGRASALSDFEDTIDANDNSDTADLPF